jgi:hypothetical protein
MFRIHDPDASPDALSSPLPPVGVLMTANREQLWIGSLQQDIDVRLVLEEWDGQPLLPDAWDEEAKARLYLRGQLTVDMGSAGVAVQRLRLSGGVGNYEVRVYARYRETVVQMYEELFQQHKDPLSDEFQREKRKLEGVERYLVQLWRDSLPRLGGLVSRLGGPRRARGFRAGRGRPGVAGAVRPGSGLGRRGRGGRGGIRRGAGLRGPGHRSQPGCLRAVDGPGTMGAERNHRVNGCRDHGDHHDREQRSEYLAPRGAEPGGRTWPPE